ncbi:hypothetical protein FDY98_25245 (plasmid) [Halomonas sp. PA16-9]|nr:hypothetical protein FDY98_25245 [Halomonas sp. PA16-9]
MPGGLQRPSATLLHRQADEPPRHHPHHQDTGPVRPLPGRATGLPGVRPTVHTGPAAPGLHRGHEGCRERRGRGRSPTPARPVQRHLQAHDRPGLDERLWRPQGPQRPAPLVTGASTPIEAVRFHESRTEPPKHYTVDTLLNAMLHAGRHAEGEDAELLRKAEGIGTPATRDTVIQTLFDREYIATQRQGKQQLIVSTPRGRAFIDNTPSMLSEVRVTARWERELDAIQNAANDTEARQRRDAFINAQRAFITQRIEEVIEDVEDAPEAITDTRNGPTENMLTAARKIAASRNLTLPEGIETSFDVCRTFLDEAMQHPAPPTDKMKALALRLADEHGVTLNGELTTFQACKAFIDKHMGSKAPTPKMIAAAEAAAKRYRVKLPDDCRTLVAACRQFLNEHPQ